MKDHNCEWVTFILNHLLERWTLNAACDQQTARRPETEEEIFKHKIYYNFIYSWLFQFEMGIIFGLLKFRTQFMIISFNVRLWVNILLFAEHSLVDDDYNGFWEFRISKQDRLNYYFYHLSSRPKLFDFFSFVFQIIIEIIIDDKTYQEYSVDFNTVSLALFGSIHLWTNPK